MTSYTMDKIFEGQVALVTGGTRGIGRSIAFLLAQAGASVAVLARNYERCQQVTAQIEQTGVKSLALSAEVADFKQVEQAIKQVLEKFGRLDMLVNNAGITKDALLIRMSKQDWDDVLAVNLGGVFNCTRCVARHMMKARRGKIVNISSVVGLSGNPGQANYTAAKAGIIGLTKTLALELAPRGITVNAVAPGFIDTDMTKELPAEVKQQILGRIPLGRFGAPEEVAETVKFLFSPAADYITGQVISVNGGMLM